MLLRQRCTDIWSSALVGWQQISSANTDSFRSGAVWLPFFVRMGNFMVINGRGCGGQQSSSAHPGCVDVLVQRTS